MSKRICIIDEPDYEELHKGTMKEMTGRDNYEDLFLWSYNFHNTPSNLGKFKHVIPYSVKDEDLEKEIRKLVENSQKPSEIILPREEMGLEEHSHFSEDSINKIKDCN